MIYKNDQIVMKHKKKYVEKTLVFLLVRVKHFLLRDFFRSFIFYAYFIHSRTLKIPFYFFEYLPLPTPLHNFEFCENFFFGLNISITRDFRRIDAIL